MLTAAILAGGQARRLGGRDKAALVVGGRAILDRQVAALGDLAARVLVVGGDPTRPVPDRVERVPDLIPGAGPVGGIYSALEAAATPRALVVACDLPFLTAAFARRLIELGRTADLVVPRLADGRAALCLVCARALGTIARQAIDEGALRLGAFIDRARTMRVVEMDASEIAAYDPDGTLLLNVNTPEDYARAIQLADRS